MRGVTRLTKRVIAVAALALVQPATIRGAVSDAVTAAEALARLKAGNERFATGAVAGSRLDPARRAALQQGQAPFAIVLSCADSSVPPELIFDAGFGDLYVVRAAGQVMDQAVLASVEFGAGQLQAPLLVVVGHEFCDTVKVAMGTAPAPGPHFDVVLKAIRPAVDRAADAPERDRLRTAVLANVEQVVNDGLRTSAVLAQRVASGQLAVVGAFFEIESGRVTFSHPVAPAAAARLTRPPGR
jgi:carbonic anhydrase